MNARALFDELCSAILKERTKEEVSELLNTLPNEKEIVYSLFSERNEASQTLLMLAATEGNPEILSLLLAYLVPNPAMLSNEAAEIINLTDKLGSTALHLACEANSKACIDLLLTYQANPFIVDQYGRVPLERVTNTKIVAHCAVHGFYIGMDLSQEYKKLLDAAATDLGCSKMPFLLLGTSIAGKLIKADEINYSVTKPEIVMYYLQRLSFDNGKRIFNQCSAFLNRKTTVVCNGKVEIIADFHREWVPIYGRFIAVNRGLQHYLKVRFDFSGAVDKIVEPVTQLLPELHHYEVNSELRKKINNLFKEFYILWRSFLKPSSSTEQPLTPIAALLTHFFANPTSICPNGIEKINEFLQSANELLADINASPHSGVASALEEVKSHLSALSQMKLVDEVKKEFVKLDKSIKKLLVEINVSSSHHMAKRQFLS